MDFGRIAAQSAKQVIMQKVREAERLRQYEEFKDRVGEIINGIVKRTEYGNVIVDVGRGEAILRRDQLIQREAFSNGDRVRALIRDVRHETRGPQIFLSRTAPEFLAELFKMEVPEILRRRHRDQGGGPRSRQPRQDGRDLLRQLDRPGRRLRRHARQPRSGGRHRAAGREDRHHPLEPGPGDLPRQRAAAGRGLQGGLRRGFSERIEVVVPDEQLSLAIGRRGQNVRLASQLTGFDIDIMTDAQESERRQAEFAERTQTFMDTMNVDEMVAQLLVAEGFATSRRSPMSTSTS